MMRKISNAVWLVLIVFAMASCDDFYSTSWGKAREYDSSKIKLTQHNLQQWKEKAVGNPALAKALVKKIISDLDSKSGAEKAAFQEAGVELAIEQAGIGTKIIEVAGSALDNIDSEDGVKDLLNKVQKGLGDDVKPAAANIAAIVSKSSLTGTNSDNGIPKFDASDDYANDASPSDVGMAVMVLALSIIPNIDGNTDLSDLSTNLSLDTGSTPNQVKITSVADASPEEIALAAYLNLIVSDEGGKFGNNLITSGIKSAFLSAGE
jgi:hypothetical protein